MKCKRGHPVDPRRGYCTHFICHNEAIGGPAPEPHLQMARTRSDRKRCPFCTGEQGDYVGACWLATCTRGPNGTRCGCHYLMSGMTAPTIAELGAILPRQRPAGAPHPAYQFAQQYSPLRGL